MNEVFLNGFICGFIVGLFIGLLSSTQGRR